MRQIGLALVFVLMGVSGGCVSDVANRYYGAIRYSARADGQVEVLSAPPTRSYEVIADFQSKGESVSSLRHKAAELGADAVIVTQLAGNVPISNEWAADKTYKSVFNERVFATAIRYK